MPFDYRPGIAAIQQGRPQGGPPALSPEARRMRDWAHSQQANSQQAQMTNQLQGMMSQLRPGPGPARDPASPQPGSAPSPGLFQPGPSDGPQPGMQVGGQAMPGKPNPGATPMPKPGMSKPIAMPKLPGGMSPFDKRGPRGI